MPNDDEIVPEGISDFLPHESHGDLSSFDVDEAHRAMRSRTDQLMADRGLTPIGERPPVVRTSIGIIGEALYPPLQIVEIPPELEGVEGGQMSLQFFMIPTTFDETFKSRWQAEELSDGRINPIYNYGGTQREISISFKLAALTVQEARSNLSVCEKLARTVYGRYRRSETTIRERVRTNTVFAGHKTFTVDFGGLIRDEKTFINKFAFATDIDAGVFDYSSGADTDVTHNKKGTVLPRALKIDIGFTIVHDTLLGFGGQNRPGEPLRWAENRKRDWPHGTGKIDVQEYMKPTTEVQMASLPRVIRYGDEDFDEVPDEDRAAALVEESLARAREGFFENPE